MMVILWTGAAFFLLGGHQGVADLVAAIIRFSLGGTTRLLRSLPAMTVSTAASKSCCSTAGWPMRTARRAASLMMLARSAPEAPTVALAMAV